MACFRVELIGYVIIGNGLLLPVFMPIYFISYRDEQMRFVRAVYMLK